MSESVELRDRRTKETGERTLETEELGRRGTSETGEHQGRRQKTQNAERRGTSELKTEEHSKT